MDKTQILLVNRIKIEDKDFQSFNALALGFTEELNKEYAIRSTQYQVDGEYLYIKSIAESKKRERKPYVGLDMK